MAFVTKVWKILFGRILADENDSELKNSAKLSEEKVAEIARLYGEQEGWMPGAVQTPPKLKYNIQNQLTWEIFFRQEMENGLPYKGGHLILFIDDETGNLIDKVIGTR